MSKNIIKAEQLNWFVKHAKLTASVCFIFLSTIIGLIASQKWSIIRETRLNEIQHILESVDVRLGQVLSNSQNIALTLALTVESTDRKNSFDEVAPQLVKANPYLHCVQLVPQGIISKVYPLKVNENAIGLNLFSDDKQNALEARKAISLKKMYFQGPVELVQGDKGVIGRLPIYFGNKFWGFSAVVIKLKDLFEIAGVNKKSEYYKFQFSKVNPVSKVEEFFIGNETELKDGLFGKKKFNEGEWTIYLSDTRSVFVDNQLIIASVLGILLSLLSSFLLFRLLKKQSDLSSLLNSQTHHLLATEDKYKTIFDNAAVGIARVNSITGEFLEANAFLCELFGYSEDALKTKKIKSIIHPEDVVKDGQSFKRMLRDEIDQFSSIIKYVNVNGDVIWANAIVSPLWKPGEKPSHHLVIIDNITEKIAYENQLIASQRSISDLVNSIDGIVWEANVGAEFTNSFISNKVFEILGYTVEEWRSDPDFHINHVFIEDRDRLKKYISTELFKNLHHVSEYRMVAKNGAIIWVRDSVTIEPNLGNPKKLRGIMMDITNLKNAEDILHKSYDLAREQNARLLNFSYIVSHNLRLHASNIEGVTSLIRNADDEAERNEMIALLEKVVGKLNDTLYNLNNVVNIQAGVSIEKIPLNLKLFVNNAIEAQESRLMNDDIDLKNNVPDDVFVLFNKAYLDSVLLNLISNAIRYRDPQKKTKIEINAARSGQGYRLTIKDNGLGIDLNRNLDKLFGFSQTFHGNNDARGFGLFITKSQIEAMGGKIEVESEVGVGTTFFVYFEV